MKTSPPSSESSAGVAAFAEYFRGHQQIVGASVASLAPVAVASGRAIIESLDHGGKIICFGNGGSATQASHLAGELVGRFRLTRRPFPALSLSSDGATTTCIGNDFGYPAVFERQIEAFAKQGDVAIGLTTSGRSENVISALAAARAHAMVTIALTGEAGLVGGDADYVLGVPSSETAYIQEVHLMLIHGWCIAIDDAFGGG